MYSRILVPLDGSTNAEHALPAAIAISRRANAAIHPVPVHEPSPSAIVTRGRADEATRREEREYLHTVAARSIACGARAVDIALTDGWAPAAIEREIARAGADLAHGVVFHNILVAMEDADADADVAEQAARLGALGGARDTLLRVVRPALVPIPSLCVCRTGDRDRRCRRRHGGSRGHVQPGLRDVPTHCRERGQRSDLRVRAPDSDVPHIDGRRAGAVT